MAERQKGVQIHRPIIYGSHARLLTPEEKQGAPPEHTHKWTVFLTSATSPPPAPGEVEDMDVLPGGADDLSYLIKRVTFKLHETYTSPSRICDQPPYRVTETGWGEFTVQIRVQFVSESSEKPMTLSHPIKLHHWGAPIEGQPVTQPVAPSAVSTPVAASQPVTTPASAVPPKEVTPKPADVEMAEVEKEAVKIESESAAEGVTGSQPPDAPYDTTMQPAQTHPAGPSSIATKYPVHAWQYDEIIFSDPPLAFYNLLNEHPPTPFPARNRRPRDQREGSKQEQTKKKKPRGSIASTSRQGTPSTPTVGTPAAQATTVPAPGVAAVGIPGEPGSADVPLEFTLEMEKGEWNKLHDAKKKVIDEMDTWRSKLIDQEQQLAKLKNELV